MTIPIVYTSTRQPGNNCLSATRDKRRRRSLKRSCKRSKSVCTPCEGTARIQVVGPVAFLTAPGLEKHEQHEEPFPPP